MWFKLIFCFLVGFTTAEYAWEPGRLYRYDIEGRTLTGLYQVANQYVGIIMKAKLTVLPKTDSHISLKIHNSHYAEVHQILKDGWTTYIPDEQLVYHQLPITNKPFELVFRNGIVEKLIVEKSLPVWQINIIKSIASQLQIDTKAINLKKSRLNLIFDEEKPLGVYKTVEDSVTGKCITVYDVSPLPRHVLKLQPQLAPQFHIASKANVIEIIKTQNYSACQQRMVYNYGISGMTDWEPGSNHMGKFMTRTNIGRTIITGNLNSYTIQSSVATNKIILSPHIYNNQKGIVASSINLTLEHCVNTTEMPLPITNPYITRNLVYEYNPAHHNLESFTTSEKYQRQKRGMALALDLKDTSDNFSSDSSEPNGENFSNSKVNIFDPYLQEKNKNAKFFWFANNNNTNSPGSKNEPMFSAGHSSTSSSSSVNSNEEFWQPQPQLNMPANIPFLPYFIGYEGYSIQSFKQIDSVSTIEKLACEIAEEVQYPNTMVKANTLTKFNIMVRIIRTLDSKQLAELSSTLYFNPSNDNPMNEERNRQETWIIFHNSVAQSGTGPALVAIKNWIQNEQVKDDEAARIIASLPYTACYPNEEYMNTFFNLIKSPEVKNKKNLNATAILAFTDLIYKTRTNNRTTHNHYPVHSFGKFVTKTNNNVENIYLPYIAEQFKIALMNNDSINIQLYTKCLGNTGHPQIINIFKPYLEGKKYMSKFQRLFIIASFDKLIKVYPNMVRPMIYNLYQNPTESYDIRIAAVMQLMKTNPPPQMLQRMAEYTYFDLSKDVSSAVKSIIMSVAELNTPGNEELAQNARVAVNMLNPDIYGLQYSKHYIRDYDEKPRNLGYENDFTYIQNKDSIIPKAIFFNLRKQMGSMKLENQQIATMVSSFDTFLEMLTNEFSSMKDNKKNETKSGMSSMDILKMINIESDNEEQFEGNVIFELFGGPSFLAFDKYSIEAVSEDIQKAANYLRNSQKFNLTKFQNKFSMSIGFPTVNGLPFVYSIDIPTYFNLSGEVSLKTKPDITKVDLGKSQIVIPELTNITAKLHFVHCLKTQSRMGFVTPFNQRHYFAGLEKNIHINVPLKIWSDFQMSNKKLSIKTQALNTEENQKLFEYSTVAYTAKDNIFDITPPLNGYGAKIIQNKPMKRFQTTVGENTTGISFEVEINSEQDLMDWKSIVDAFRHDDVISNWLYPYAEKNIYNNNITLTFNPQKSVTNTAQFSFNIETDTTSAQLPNKEPDVKKKKKKLKYHGKNKQEPETPKYEEFQDGTKNGAVPDSILLDSLRRKNLLLAETSSGIKSPSTLVVDATAEFIGENSVYYIMTMSHANSAASGLSRTLLIYSKSGTPKKYPNSQVIVDTSLKIPKMPLMNYKEAIKVTSPVMDINGKIYFSDKTRPIQQIAFTGNMTRSSERLEYVRQTPTAKLCAQQMLKGNYILSECREVINLANVLDEINITWKYDKIPDYLNYLTNNIFTWVKHNSYDFYSEEASKTAHDQKTVKTSMKYGMKSDSVNITIKYPMGVISFKNVPVGQFMRKATHLEPIRNIVTAVANESYTPICALDGYAMSTFDGTTFPVDIGTCWYLLFQNLKGGSRHDGEPDGAQYITVLVRENGFKQREIRILSGPNTVDVTPMSFDGSAANIVINGNKKKLEMDSMNLYSDEDGEELARVHIAAGGVTVVYIPKHGIELDYDGIRIFLKVSYSYRGKVAGLCGTFDGESTTDFLGPGKCDWSEPSELIWSYAVVDESCVGPPKVFLQRYGNTTCVMKRDRQETKTEETKEVESNAEKDECRQEQQVQTFQEEGLICFSLKPYSVCSSGCKALETNSIKVDFHCLSDNVVARHWLEMVKGGAIPDFTQKAIDKSIEISIPLTCSLK